MTYIFNPGIQKSPLAVNSTENEGVGLPLPKHIIFTKPLVHAMTYPLGAGLVNVGNTCFLNATLQCLIHTPPLTNYMMSGHHSSICPVRNHEKCILCNLQALTMQSVYGEDKSFTPRWFINNLLPKEDDFYTEIGRNFGNGRQEDAHEYLRLTLERMQRCALIGQDHLDKYSKETNLINQIFGGYLRSQVCCSRCGRRSNTYDPMMDLCVEATTTIQEAFNKFVKAEVLEFENAYSCVRCQRKVTALKQMSIHRAPTVLTIQLKRFHFSSTGIGSKVHQQVHFPARLDIRAYMSEKQGPPVTYILYGTILHKGVSSDEGHYVANILSGNKWHCFDDSNITKRTVKQCLNDKGTYLMFYQREFEATPQLSPSILKKPQQAELPRQKLPEKKPQQADKPRQKVPEKKPQQAEMPRQKVPKKKPQQAELPRQKLPEKLQKPQQAKLPWQKVPKKKPQQADKPLQKEPEKKPQQAELPRQKLPEKLQKPQQAKLPWQKVPKKLQKPQQAKLPRQKVPKKKPQQVEQPRQKVQEKVKAAVMNVESGRTLRSSRQPNAPAEPSTHMTRQSTRSKGNLSLPVKDVKIEETVAQGAAPMACMLLKMVLLFISLVSLAVLVGNLSLPVTVLPWNNSTAPWMSEIQTPWHSVQHLLLFRLSGKQLKLSQRMYLRTDVTMLDWTAIEQNETTILSSPEVKNTSSVRQSRLSKLDIVDTECGNLDYPS